MKWLGRLFLVAAVAALGWWLWQTLFPGDEAQIRKLLARTARAASFSSRDGALRRMGSIAEFGNCFTPDVQVYFDMPRQGRFALEGREQMIGLAARSRDSVVAVSVTLVDVSVQLEPDHLSATAGLTARADISGEVDFSVQELKVFFRKVNGQWLIYRVESVKTLSAIRPESNLRTT